MIEIRPATDDDIEGIWPIFHQVVSGGDTYPYPSDTDRDDAISIWVTSKSWTFVAIENGFLTGTYFLDPNVSGRGSHIANAGFMVDRACQGRGIGRSMLRHSLVEAVAKGFRGMQFNLVVSTNVAAVALWKREGFHIVGALPCAFRHAQEGLVDAYVMFRSLDDIH